MLQNLSFASRAPRRTGGSASLTSGERGPPSEAPLEVDAWTPTLHSFLEPSCSSSSGSPTPASGPGHRNQLGVNRGANARVQVAVSTDSMPMYDSLADQIKYFLLNGGDYHVAPNLGSDVLDRIDAFVARFLGSPRALPPHPGAVVRALLAHGLLDHTPRLLFVSPEASCGKTLPWRSLKHLVPRPDRQRT